MNFNLQQTEIDTYSNQFHEAVQMYGIEAKYILAENISEDNILGEHNYQNYTSDNTYDVFVRMENMSNFDGEDIMSGFGIEMTDTVNFLMSKITFENMSREPQPNDIVVIPYMDRIFEVTRIEKELEGVGFYGGQTRYVGFKLTAHLYRNDNDTFSTDIDIVDDLTDRTNEEITLSNDEIETVANEILDNSEKTPWGAF